MMLTLFGAFLLTLLIVVTIAIIRTPSLFAAVMLLGIFSFLMAATFFILDAADVALTEAAVGAGISTVLSLGALALTGDTEKQRPASRLVPMGIVALTMLVVIYASFDMPRLGDPGAPIHHHVVPWYLENTEELIDIPNVVAAILASFRGYDTLGEVFVVLTAGIGVLFMLSARRGDAATTPAVAPETTALKHHLVPRIVGTMVVPFVLLFGLYVQFHGEYSPGGGFQAGAIVAAALILHALLEGERSGLKVIPPRVLFRMMASGAAIYALVGVAGILFGGNFLDYSVLAGDPVAGQHLGIALVEFGVGITVTGVLLSVYHAFARRG